MGRNKTNKIDYKFVPFPVEVLESKAWGRLTNAARVAYLHIRKKWTFNRGNPVSLTYLEMERIMGRKTFAKALKQLESIGFVKKTQSGGIFRKRNYFDMSEEWRRRDRAEPEIKSHEDGISIKGSQMHTVEKVKKMSTGG